MTSAGKKRSTGERVLEGRHVIGLFMLMLLFSGVFFTLGYVMGRGQFDGSVSASSKTPAHAVTPRDDSADVAIEHKDDSGLKMAAGSGKSAASPVAEVPAPASSDWDFYGAGKSEKANERLRPAASAPRTVAVSAPMRPAGQPRAAVKAPVVTSKSARRAAPKIPAGAYVLQVAALTKESDAMDLAAHLQKKKFPAFVQSPGADKFYRVQVGPYADQKGMTGARKGLESAGFKAIVKH
jgi:cell division septation protein DedD